MFILSCWLAPFILHVDFFLARSFPFIFLLRSSFFSSNQQARGYVDDSAEAGDELVLLGELFENAHEWRGRGGPT
jgi:hypothetical protein